MTTIRYFAAAAEATGLESEVVTYPAGATVADVTADLTARHPAIAGVLALCALIADGVRLDGPDASLADPALIDVLPPFAGG